MTDVMVQRGLGQVAPASRQDVVSALLNDYYGAAFDEEEPTTSVLSPAFKELPSPPPGSGTTPLAVQRMNTKFPLRDQEDEPLSPQSPQSGASTPRSRKRIVSRSLSRDGKPPSLKLVISNGTTATIPPTPAFPVPTRTLYSSQPSEKKEFQNKELPPPPPAKSDRRNTQQAPVDNQQPEVAKDLARNDSVLSPSGKKGARQWSPEKLDVVPIVKRKAVPEPTMKKFQSLAELGQGPRGGKGGPMPPAIAARKTSVDSAASDATTRKASMDSWNSTDSALEVSNVAAPSKDVQQRQQAPARNQLPPTPDQDEKNQAPAPPRKVFAAVGLPSNPRGRSPPSPLHMRGKSSTGFNLLKAHRPAPPVPTANPQTITPELTPSPTLKPDQRRKDAEISPVSPLPPPRDQSHSLSSEKHTPESQAVPAPAVAVAQPTLAQAPAQAQAPLRSTSLDPPPPSPSMRPSSAPSQHTPELSHSPPSSVPSSPLEATPPPPPFTPLTRQHIPLPITLIPQITPAQLNCYVAHRTTVWSNNAFQPMGCMVCHTNDRDRKWACTWCQLRICRACTDELCMEPRRDLGRLLMAKQQAMEREIQEEFEGKEMPGIVVSGEEEVDDGYENTFRA